MYNDSNKSKVWGCGDAAEKETGGEGPQDRGAGSLCRQTMVNVAIVHADALHWNGI